MKTEAKFIAELEKKAKEQRRLTETELMPRWAKRIGGWLTINPWRVIVPLGAIAYGGWRMARARENLFWDCLEASSENLKSQILKCTQMGNYWNVDGIRVGCDYGGTSDPPVSVDEADGAQ